MPPRVNNIVQERKGKRERKPSGRDLHLWPLPFRLLRSKGKEGEERGEAEGGVSSFQCNYIRVVACLHDFPQKLAKRGLFRRKRRRGGEGEEKIYGAYSGVFLMLSSSGRLAMCFNCPMLRARGVKEKRRKGKEGGEEGTR